MKLQKIKPSDIEKESMRLIEEELGDTPALTEPQRMILKRVIHTTADFDYKENLKFSEHAVEQGLQALKEHAVIVTDTNMAKAGISKPALAKLGCELHCFMADEDIAQKAKEQGVTRASLSMQKAAALFADRPLIFAIGNAPTALVSLYEMQQAGQLHASLIIAAAVGFVNVTQSKQLIMQMDIPYITADGRKGGSNVAAAICNALLYQLYDRNVQ